MRKTIPLLKSYDDQTEKITVYLPKRAAEAYRKGKYNGYDTPKISRQAVIEALLSLEDDLMKPIVK